MRMFSLFLFCCIPVQLGLCADLWDDPVECIVIVSTDRGSGTGFVCTLNGKKYVITNTHVLRGAQRFEFHTLAKGELRPLQLEIANDRDLARVSIAAPTASGFQVAAKKPSLGEAVSVLGNSLGQRVVTRLKGTVEGVGPEVIEISAEFVQGNSGSPIINSAGEVLGVATFVTRHGSKDWVTEGTRFAGTRRFGVRVTEDIDWRLISMRRFYEESSLLADCEDLLESLSGLIRANDLRAFELWKDRQPEYSDAEFRRRSFNEIYLRGNLNQYVGDSRRRIRSFGHSYAHTMRWNAHRLLSETSWTADYHKDLAGSYLKVLDEFCAAFTERLGCPK